MAVEANFIAPCGERGDRQEGVGSCVDNGDFADDRSKIGVVSADGRGGIGKDDAKGFGAWLGRESQSSHRGRVRNRDIGAAVDLWLLCGRGRQLERHRLGPRLL